MRDNSKMKIGYVLKRFPRLSETFVLNEILALERAGIEVEIFSLLKPPQEERHGVLERLKAKVTYLPSTGNLGRIKMLQGLGAAETSFGGLVDDSIAGFGDLYPAKTGEAIAALHIKAAVLSVLAQQNNVQQFHAHFGSDATTVALLASRLSGVGYSFTAHARDIYHTYSTPNADNAMRRQKISEASFVVTVSDYNARYLRSLAPASASHIHRLYNGIDLDRFRKRSNRPQKRKILAIGRLIEKKGFTHLINACSLLAAKGVEFECEIVGEGPLRTDLENQIIRFDLAARVSLVGSMAQEKLIETVSSAELVVLPCVVSESGDRDGLPTVLLEAMAMGVPTITTTVSGGPEIVVDGKTGFLVEPADEVDLAAKLERILDDPELAQQMGCAGRRRAENLFSLEKNAQALAEYFRSNAQSHVHALERAS